jgi:hypothetical protein
LIATFFVITLYVVRKSCTLLAVQIFGGGFMNNLRSENLKVRDYLENLDASYAVKVCEGVVWVNDLA